MKYILLMYAEEGAWPEHEHKLAIEESVQICHDLHAEGKYVSASPLFPPTTATTVRVRGGRTLLSDGPFAETKEQLGGYFLIDVDSLDEAISIAAKIPGTRRGTAEVRPIYSLPEGLLPEQG